MAVAPSNHKQNYIVLPLYRPSRSRRCCVIFAVGLLLCLAIVCVFWPSYPNLKIVRLKLKRVKVHSLPHISVDMSVFVTVRVHNANAYWMELAEVDVAIRYRGKKLGHVESEDEHVRARGSSDVDGKVEIEGLAGPEAVHLVKDLTKRRVAFHTVTQVTAQLGFLFFHSPFTFEEKLSCEVLVYTKNQTIVGQHCFHE